MGRKSIRDWELRGKMKEEGLEETRVVDFYVM